MMFAAGVHYFYFLIVVLSIPAFLTLLFYSRDTSWQLVTDYQFISVILSFYDNSPNKVWYTKHVYPNKRNKYFNIYKTFFIDNIKNRKINAIYILKPMYGHDNVFRNILSTNCFRTIEVNDILEKHLIQKCDELK